MIFKFIELIFKYENTRLFFLIAYLLFSPIFLTPTTIDFGLFYYFSLPIFLILITRYRRGIFKLLSIEENTWYKLLYEFIFCLPLIIYSFDIAYFQSSSLLIQSILLLICCFFQFISLSEYITYNLYQIIRAGYITPDILTNAVFMYLLFGVFWYNIYLSIYLIDSHAFSIPNILEQPFDLLYFSFTTLTTLGYGDIYPVSIAAKVIANSESILGVVFTSVVIATLIGRFLDNN